MSTGIMIIGPSGSGKTTLGRLAAQKLGFPFFDVDDYICSCRAPHFADFSLSAG